MILYVVLFVYIFLKNQNSFFIKKLKKSDFWDTGQKSDFFDVFPF